MNIATFGKDAVARYYQRHAKADDLHHNSAAFTWNRVTKLYEIEVCGFIVAEVLTIRAVEIFCDHHNSRIA